MGSATDEYPLKKGEVTVSVGEGSGGGVGPLPSPTPEGIPGYHGRFRLRDIGRNIPGFWTEGFLWFRDAPVRSMSLIPRKDLIQVFDTVVPSRYVSRFRKAFIIDPVMGYDVAMRGRLSHYGDAERREFQAILREIRSETELLIEDIEAYFIHMAVKRTAKVPGDIAEVGVYRGGSAKIICRAKGDRPLHLFDTFEGLPRVDEIDSVWPFYEGKFSASEDLVREYLRDFSQVSIYRGIFPATGMPVQDRQFSFLNLDVDTHRSTRDCLEFFYPRMSPGGIILSHDYVNTPGVRKAFDEFFLAKPEPVLETAASQCMVAKV